MADLIKDTRYLRTKEAAHYVGLSARTLEKHRTYGTGPRLQEGRRARRLHARRVARLGRPRQLRIHVGPEQHEHLAADAPQR